MTTRILILGGPKAGKTTEARKLGERLNIKPRHFDDLKDDHEWSEVSDLVAKELDEPGPWIKEGVAGVRGLRKWLKNHPHETPPFEIKVLRMPKEELSSGQRAMHNQHMTILRECMLEIEKRKRKTRK